MPVRSENPLAAGLGRDAREAQRRGLGVGLRAESVGVDVTRDLVLVRTGSGAVDVAAVDGVTNLCQALSVALTTLRGSDVLNLGFGFLGLSAMASQSSPVLAREGLRSAVAECVAADPRVRRIVDLQAANPMATTPGARRAGVEVTFETVDGATATVSVGGLSDGAQWGTATSLAEGAR